MKKLTRQEKHEQCMREIRGTLIVVLICCAWHIASAFLLNGTGLYFLLGFKPVQHSGVSQKRNGTLMNK